MTRNRKYALRLASACLLALAVICAASAGWVHAKAALAQVLMQHAWSRSQQQHERIKPWPWADVAPVAELELPRLGKRYIVLDNDSGQALAFGPGWTPSSAPLGKRGLSVVSAHRDTQFRALARLHEGDVVRVATAYGQRDYRIDSLRIVDSTRTRLGDANSADALLLVTCYPFEAIVPGGPLRYVAEAVPLTPAI